MSVFPGSFEKWQRSALLAGILLVLFALVSDGHTGVWGETIKVACPGVFIILIAVFGRRFPSFYRSAATQVLNTIILILAVEVASAYILVAQGLLSSGSDEEVDARAAMSYYREQPWGQTYWEESMLWTSDYKPYVGWRASGPEEGETVNLDDNGYRVTPGAQCTEGAYTIFLLGGSTMWGLGAPDWATIPAFLQEKIAEQRDEPVCVVNLGELAYVSTQEVINLTLELQQNHVPDLVIFYDGVNDLYAMSQSGVPGAHQNLDQIEARVEGSSALIVWTGVYFSHTLRLVGVLAHGGRDDLAYTYSEEATRPDALRTQQAQAVIDTYLGNYRLVETLAAGYGFEFYFFWQPVSYIGNKALTDEELEFQTRHEVLPNHAIALLRAGYPMVEAAAEEYPNLTYLGNIFDNQTESIYIDWHHITPVGNEIVAEAMIEAMRGE